MYPRSFLCEEAKIKQRTPLLKELCEIGEEAIWQSRFTSFFTNLFSFIYTIEYRTQTNPKKSSEKKLRNFDSYRAGMMLC